ncbi:MAG: TonB-dependent receptor [Bacteroidota bacterium]|nr:TonB-dependent receptor [Bacteroidota bacterium]MDX5430249.1 TonB-dependent receptor [Bacteroidota bacterium]MDX5469010.1 TonB-dependent receptor [Bacteroidota bacterium]
MRRLFFILLSCFSLVSLAQGIQISGLVVDASTRMPLEFASVYWGKYGTLTNQKGECNVTLPDTSTAFQVAFVGYTSRRIPIKLGTVYRIELQESASVLENVVVSANKQDEREITTPVSVASIQPYLVQNRISTSVEQVISQVPGITSTDGQANIRSGSGWSYGTGSRVSVLVDDMPMLAAGTGQALWSFFPVENIRQVEIIKGSSSVLYGSSALNGVINIRTEWPGNKELLTFSSFAGVYGAPPNSNWKWKPASETFLTKAGGHFLYGKGKDRFQYVVSLNGLIDEGYRMGDQNKRVRGSFKTRQFSKDKKWSYGLNGNVLFGKTGSFLLWEDYSMAYTSLDSAFGLNRSQRVNLDPYLNFHGTHFDHFIQARWYDVQNRIDSVAGEPDQSNQTQSIYAEYRLKWKQLAKQGLIVNIGLVQLYGQSEANMFQGFRVQQNHAAYLQVDFKKGRWNLNAGARYESYRIEQYNESKPVLKFGANYQAAKATFLRASFGQGYRFPVVSEAFIRTSAGPVTIYPNPDLKSETGYTAELGIRQGFQSNGGFSLLADLAFFRMEFDNMMEFTFAQWVQPVSLNELGFGFRSVNIGPALIQGAELSLTGRMKKGTHEWLFFGGYTYSDAQTKNPDFVYANPLGFPFSYKNTSTDTTGKRLKYRNRHLIKGDVQWEGTRWGAGLSYRYTSRFEAIDNAFQDPPISIFVPGVKASMEANKKGNHVTDFRIFYRFASDWKMTFTVNNLFNAEILTRPCDMAAPRNMNIQISYCY